MTCTLSTSLGFAVATTALLGAAPCGHLRVAGLEPAPSSPDDNSTGGVKGKRFGQGGEPEQASKQPVKRTLSLQTRFSELAWAFSEGFGCFPSPCGHTVLPGTRSGDHSAGLSCSSTRQTHTPEGCSSPSSGRSLKCTKPLQFSKCLLNRETRP